jgi:TolB-like protein/DNA-binding winged helix-turn-helix (wHTH) protein/Tfp pilus assembly protein PilF
MAPGNHPTIALKVARFGPYEADPRSGELRKSGMRLKIGLQSFQVLTILLEKRGDMVTREELRERIWPSGTFVDFENGLNKAVAKLRGILNDDPTNPRFIETVPRRGYRFLAPVEFLEVNDNSGAESNNLSAADRGRGEVSIPREDRRWSDPTRKLAGRAAWVLGVLTLLTITAIVYTQHRNRQQASRATIHSIAVLPFDNVSGNPGEEYFAAGMTDEMVKNLGQLASVRVISAASASRFKHTGVPLGQIGREMGVDALIEGRAAHAGDKVRLTVRLFNVADNDYLWAGDYTSNIRQLPAAQEEITRTIAQQIRLQFSAPEKPSQPRYVPVPEAYEAYLEGRYYYYHWGNRWALVWWKKSCDYFRQAIQLDPKFAPAYAGLAECYTAMNYTGMEVPEKDRIGLDQALAMAQKAIQLDDALAEAHAALGTIYLNDWRWSPAREEYRKAVALQPNDPQLRFRLAGYYRAVGDMRHAVEEAKEAKRLDPASPGTGFDLGWMYLHAEDDAKAEGEFKNVLAQEPGSIPALRGLFEVYDRRHKYAEAIKVLADLLGATRHPDRAKKMLEIYHNRGYAQAMQYQLREEIRDDYHENAKPFYLATDYARLGDKERALAYLERAYVGHAPQMKLLKANRDFLSIASDARFQGILKKLRLDDASLLAKN